MLNNIETYLVEEEVRMMQLDKNWKEYAEKERQRLDAKEDKECQTIIGEKYFNKKPTEVSSRNGSGSL